MADIPTADRSWIDAAAKGFERAWNNGERPRIEEFLIKSNRLGGSSCRPLRRPERDAHPGEAGSPN